MTKHEEQFGELRSELEKDKLDRKVKQFEQEHPDVDLTPIYENEKTERARQVLSRKAYASYKAFHFLKQGVTRGEDLLTADRHAPVSQLSSAKRRLRDNDPYNFPELDQTVKSVLSPDIDSPQLNDAGDVVVTPGRRLRGYTQQEYLTAYFGKDMARKMQTQHLEDPLYTKQKSLKEKYPLDAFLLGPQVREKEKQLEELGLGYDPKTFPHEMLPKDPAFKEHLRHRDEEFMHMTENDREINKILLKPFLEEVDKASKTPFKKGVS